MDLHNSPKLPTLEGRYQAIQALGQGGLPGARGTHDANHLTRFHGEIYPTEGRSRRTVVPECYAAQFDRRYAQPRIAAFVDDIVTRRMPGVQLPRSGGRSGAGVTNRKREQRLIGLHRSMVPANANRMNGLTTTAIALSYG